jgi:hypothetical protein
LDDDSDSGVIMVISIGCEEFTRIWFLISLSELYPATGAVGFLDVNWMIARITLQIGNLVFKKVISSSRGLRRSTNCGTSYKSGSFSGAGVCSISAWILSTVVSNWLLISVRSCVMSPLQSIFMSYLVETLRDFWKRYSICSSWWLCASF